MRQEKAKAFAAQVLMLNRHMGVFDVELSNSPEAEVVAESFESLGCRVAKDQFKPRLTVVPPLDRNT